MNVISLGAGVQSTTMALMAAHREITPMPDCAIFADTGSEPATVYEHLRWLMSPNVLPFPVHIVGKSTSLHDDLMHSGKRRYAAIPVFLARSDGRGMAQRQCTKEYKVEPLMKKQRELLGYKPRARIPAGAISVWIGISMDETIRMKPSRVPWALHRWPLIENGMARRHCLTWLERNGYPQPSKSACTFCPYRSDREWRALRDSDPAGWKQAIEVDLSLRDGSTRHARDLKSAAYLHGSLKPLTEVDLRTDAEAGQPDLFNNECEGMCGV